MKRIVVTALFAGLLATPVLAQTGAPTTITTPMQNNTVGNATTSQSTPRLNADKDPHKASETKDAAQDKPAAQPKPAEGEKAPAATK